jgi:hypothetical protein
VVYWHGCISELNHDHQQLLATIDHDDAYLAARIKTAEENNHDITGVTRGDVAASRQRPPVPALTELDWTRTSKHDMSLGCSAASSSCSDILSSHRVYNRIHPHSQVQIVDDYAEIVAEKQRLHDLLLSTTDSVDMIPISGNEDLFDFGVCEDVDASHVDRHSLGNRLSSLSVQSMKLSPVKVNPSKTTNSNKKSKKKPLHPPTVPNLLNLTHSDILVLPWLPAALHVHQSSPEAAQHRFSEFTLYDKK